MSWITLLYSHFVSINLRSLSIQENFVIHITEIDEQCRQ